MKRALDSRQFVLSAEVQQGRGHPYSLPALRGVDSIEFRSAVTFFIGENGSGKSTIIEAIAHAAGFNLEGGSKNFQFETVQREESLPRLVRLIRSPRWPSDGYFLRAESFFNVATEIDRLGVTRGYGGTSLHEQSHGEAFMALLVHRLLGDGALHRHARLPEPPRANAAGAHEVKRKTNSTSSSDSEASSSSGGDSKRRQPMRPRIT